MSRLALPWWLLLVASGCGSRTVTVRVTMPDVTGVETPLAGFVVSFLPYDRDSIVRTLESKAGPRPHQRELDSLYRAFRGPFVTFLMTRDSADRFASRRDSLAARLGPERDARAALRALADSVASLERRADAARAALELARRDLAPSIDRYRAAVRDWQDSVFRDYRALTKSSRVFANAVSDTTDAFGWATVTLTNGRWWATATSFDPVDPNAEWYWNVRLDRDTILLDPRTGRHRPRY